MSKKLFGKAAGVLALVIGMAFISCDDKVTINISKAPAVKAVTVTKTTNNQYYIVSWDGVSEEVNYRVYFHQDGRKSSVVHTGGDIQSEYTYDPATGEELPNADFDKWSYRVSAVDTETAGSYSFGVRSDFKVGRTDQTSSSITWSTPFAIAAGPKVASVSASATTDNRFIIVKWNAFTGADKYDAYGVFVERDGIAPLDIYKPYDYGQNVLKYAVADGASTANDEESNWAYKYGDYYGSVLEEGTYRFSVRAYNLDKNSKPVEDIGIAQGVRVFSQTVTITED